MSAVITEKSKGAGLDPTIIAPLFRRSTPGLSDDAKTFDKIFRGIAMDSERRWLTSAPPALTAQRTEDTDSPAERLYDSLAAAKTMTSRIAMHMDEVRRTQLFSRLDSLLDKDNWYDEDPAVKPESFATFLRFLLFLNPSQLPGLGASDDGELVAGWNAGPDRLTMIFLTDDKVRFVSSRVVNEEREYMSFHVPVTRLRHVTVPNYFEHWFDDDIATNS